MFSYLATFLLPLLYKRRIGTNCRSEHEKDVIKIQYMLPGSNKMWQIYFLYSRGWSGFAFFYFFMFQRKEKNRQEGKKITEKEQINSYQYNIVLCWKFFLFLFCSPSGITYLLLLLRCRCCCVTEKWIK